MKNLFRTILAVLAAAPVLAQEQGPTGHYYQVVMEPNLTWNEAKTRAEGMTLNGVHGHLATITNAEEDQFIEQLRMQAAPGGYGSLWVGGSQMPNALGPQDGWTWVNGEGRIPMPGEGAYSNWQPTEPNDYWGYNSESYLSVGHFNTFGWNDEPDDRHIHGFVVEFPSGGTRTTVRVTALDPFAVEDGTANAPLEDEAIFEFTRDGETALDLPVFYSIHGTARNGSDYQEISHSVIIPAGQRTARLRIIPMADALAVVEPMETVGIRIERSLITNPEASYQIDATSREAGAIIVEMRPPQNGAIEIAVPRSGFAYEENEPVTLLAVAYSTEQLVQATFVVNGFDIGTVTLASQSGNLFFYRNVWQNAPPGTHGVSVMARTPSGALLQSTTVNVTVRGQAQPNLVGIRFVQEPTAVPPPNADYAPGYFEVFRTGNLGANLQVFYSVGGTATAGSDYESLPGTVVIAANRSTARIQVFAHDDDIDEVNETVVLTVVPPAAPPGQMAAYAVDSQAESASLTIYDNDEPPALPTVEIDYSIGDISEPRAGAVSSTIVTVRRSGAFANPQRVFLRYSGTATRGFDYSSGPSEVIIPSGQESIQFPLHTQADSLREITEIVRVIIVRHDTATPGDSAGGAYRIDSEDGSIVLTIEDNGLGGEPSVTLTNPEPGHIYGANRSILLTAVGVDPSGHMPRMEFYANGTKVGESRIDFAVPPPPGTPIEHSFQWQNVPAGTYGIAARGFTAGGRVAGATPIRIDVVTGDGESVISLSAAPLSIAENEAGGVARATSVTLSRTGRIDVPIRVFLDYAGTATADVDYGRTPGEFIIPQGYASASFTIAALPDGAAEGDEQFTVSVAPYIPSADPHPANRPYSIDPAASSATITIQDASQPTTPVVSISAFADTTHEPSPNMDVAPAVLVLRRTGSTEHMLDVYVAFSGTATARQDYSAPPNWLRFPVGQSLLRVEIYAHDDNLVEGPESIIAMLQQPQDGAPLPYQIDPQQRNATLTIIDNDGQGGEATVRIVTADPIAREITPEASPDTARFRISRVGSTASELRVFYTVHGTAENGVDYNQIPQSIVIPPGQSFADIEIAAIPEFNMPVNMYEIVQAPGLTWSAARDAAAAMTRQGVSGHLATITSASEDEQIETMRQMVGGGAYWVGGFQPAGETSVYNGWQWLNNEGPIPGANDGTQGYANWLPGEPNDYWGPASENHMVIGWLNTFGWNDQGEQVGAQGYVVEWEIQTPAPPVDEGMETVGIRLVESPVMSPTPSYTIDAEHDMAGAVIFDREQPDSAMIAVAIPSPGESMNVPVEFLAAAYHPSTAITDVDFYVDGQRVASSSVPAPAVVAPAVIFHSAQWAFPTQGHHVLVVRAAGPGAGTIASPGTPFVIGGGSENLPPHVSFTAPSDGAVFVERETISIVVEAVDNDGSIARVELFADGQLIATSQTPTLLHSWTGAAPEPHILTARATDNQGATGMSPEVRVLVRRADAIAFVRRALPAGYSPGVPFAVTLRAEPPAGAHAYAVEDRPPQGWTVSNISDNGVFDAATGKVKFGPFTDSQARTLSYRVTPPANATGRHQFIGASSLNGTEYPIGGHEFVEQAQQHHPADSDRSFAIVLNEVTAYAAAWKAGESWPTGPSPIPLSYVTAAGNIWRNGEAYRFDPGAGAAPDCWAPNTAPRAMAVEAVSPPSAQRTLSAELRAGTSAQVRISVTPGTGTSSYALEERAPRGWAISNISNGGVLDPETGVIRWGLYLDGSARLFTYSVTPPNVATAGAFSGQVSADGGVFEIATQGSTTNEAAAPIALSQPAPDGDGVRLLISGPSGQTGVLEASSDFRDWSPVRQVFLPDGGLEVFDDGAAPEGHRFYRLRVD